MKVKAVEIERRWAIHGSISPAAAGYKTPRKDHERHFDRVIH